jgi:hypothetical protein
MEQSLQLSDDAVVSSHLKQKTDQDSLSSHRLLTHIHRTLDIDTNKDELLRFV